MKRVTIIDYGLGNLFNLETALRVVGADAVVTSDPAEAQRAERLVLPGVGAFGPGMKVLREKSFEPAIREFAASGRPLLGICLGMQFLMTESEEDGVHGGFDFIAGRVVRFESEQAGERVCKVPQISWNALVENERAERPWAESVLRDVPVGANMYFVHSYYVKTVSPAATVAYTEYGGQRYSSVVGQGNVHGAQFHPERSGAHGLHLLKNFLEL
ncbi:MAG: hisH [Betaproteobacteria bacterium]|jgi:glutamine amidotransferase|nr:hisH [Betaproteobacteria bacterium]